MKKFFLILMTFMVSFSVYAETMEKEAEVEVSAVAETKIWWSVKEVDLSNLRFPYQITVSAPPGTIAGVSGPTFPNMQNWSVSGGVFTINLTSQDFMEFTPGMKGVIEIYMTNNVCYCIEINFK